MKIWVLAAMSALIFLASCAVDSSNAQVLVLTDEYTVRGYTFAVSANAPHTLTGAAAFFGDRVYEISFGQMKVQSSASNNPLQDLLDGTAQLAFLSSGEIAGLSEYIAAMRLPFAYRGYTHFAMAVNNADVLSILTAEMDEEHSVQLIAGFFYGARLFLSQGVLPEFPDNTLEEVAVVLPNSNMAYGLEVMGYYVVTQASYERRIAMLESGDAFLVEVTTLELTTNSDWIESRFDIILSRHDMDMQFLVVQSDFWNNLAPASRAALTEAASYMSPIIDNAHLRRDVMLQNMINHDDAQIHIHQVPEVLPLISRSAWYQNRNVDELFRYLAELVARI